MKLGINVGYVAGRDALQQQLQMVKAAEAAGYDSAWASEAYGSDAGSPLAWFAGHTEKIKLGAAIFQIPGRSPGNCAMVASTIDCISNGRFILGIGSSGPQVAEGWHGQPFAHQLQRTREYITIVRMALSRERVKFDGEIYKLPLPDGLGKPLKLMLHPIQERIPIYLAAIGPKNTQLAGEIADGWLPMLYSPEHVGDLNNNLFAGIELGGRTRADVQISPSIFAATGNGDPDKLRDRIRPMIALYVGGMGARNKNFYNRLVSSYGFEDQAKVIQDLYLDQKYDEAAGKVPSELVDLVSLIGTEDQVRERLAAYREIGVDNLLVSPMSVDHDERCEILETVARANS